VGRAVADGSPDLVIVGAASRDIDRDDPRGWRLGGSVTYGALLAARLGIRVGALIGADADAARSHELQLLERDGVEVALVELPRGPVFDNIETPRGREQIGHAPSDPLPIDALPERWRRASAFLLGPIADEIPAEWADVPGEDALVGLAWQGLLRRIVGGRPVEPVPPRPSRLIARADLGAVSVEDLRAGGGELDELLSREGQELCITADVKGALHVRREGGVLRMRRLPAVPARRTVDRTGAGDSFHTAWLVGRLARGGLAGGDAGRWRALHLAAVAGSLAVETVGLAGIPDRRELARRLREVTARRIAPG
jgi:sugar/nucleoside kinase (ribokinase family)